ncbi:hypothetical protein COCCADRAFT_113835 [Bipolaris zeicola 26-R-13]|uniref:Uncharacterized protein n=1 Tax=Cochliobolus carbonum (strain 26-R-13) TaxID=930089 RepID=W6XM38_COCC2|nr:uncharacterized protein COCCADRAFT_113835 [Bipolaris zeicola 26-R-13]EUC26623.1 hypothetical protein COCCADRAFT_113835 [Bipolaris zeicola 26-R-13]
MQILRIFSVLLSLAIATALPVPESANEIFNSPQLSGRNRCLYNTPITCSNNNGCPSNGGCASAGVCFYDC